MKIKKKLNENNLYIKLLSLVVAIFLWSYVIGIVNPEINMTHRGIEVQTEGIAYLQREGLSVISPENPRVNVEVFGTKSDLSNIKSSNIVAVMNLEGLAPGENTVDIDVSIQGISGRVSVVDVEPSSIVVYLDEVVSDNIRIEVETLGELPENYTVGNVRALTNYVRVTAPSQINDQIAKVVAYADISGKTETFMVNSNLVFLDKNNIEINDLETNISAIDIEVPIYKLKSVPIDIETTGTLSSDETIENIKTNPENIVIRGNREVIDTIDSIQTETINLNELIATENYNVTLRLPEGVAVHELGNIELVYDYTSSSSKILSIPTSDVDLRNRENGFNYNITDSIRSINVVIYGETSLISSITASDIDAFLNVSGLQEGEQLVNITITAIDNIEIRSISPESIELTISNGDTDNIAPIEDTVEGETQIDIEEDETIDSQGEEEAESNNE